ncbi:MAG: winged helix DNA-binding domain-containing protein [Kibdelosporangium sp.]
MDFSWTGVCARRLAQHSLTVPSHGRPADVVAAMAGTHAQVMSAAELSLGLRIAGATRNDVRDALWKERTLIKTFGPRGTVHLLPAKDLPLWVGALSAVPVRTGPWTDDVRMTGEQTEQVLAAIGQVLDGAELTIDELTEALAGAVGSWAADLVMPAFQVNWPRWRQVTHLAGFRGVLCFGADKGREVTYTNPGVEPAGRAASLRHVVRSYLRAYGPSTPQRFAHWLSAPVKWACDVFESADLREVDVEGTRAWIVPGDLDVPEPVESVFLLPYFDGYSYRVGNQPSGLLYPGKAKDRVLTGNFQNLVIDGVVTGLWHQRKSGRRVDITVEPLRKLTRRQRAQLDEQAERVGEIVEAKPAVTIGVVTVGGHA